MRDTPDPRNNDEYTMNCQGPLPFCFDTTKYVDIYEKKPLIYTHVCQTQVYISTLQYLHTLICSTIINIIMFWQTHAYHSVTENYTDIKHAK